MSVLPYAEAETVTRLRPVARRRAEWYLNETIHQRHAAAARTRSVQIHDLDDAMAELILVAPAVLVHGIHDRLTRMAREVADADAQSPHEAATPDADTMTSPGRASTDHRASRRTLDAIRADVLADILLSCDPGAHAGRNGTGLSGIHATVQVTVPALALMDSRVDDPFAPTTLAGFGPIDPDTARSLAGGASHWERILTHPISGAVLAVDGYRPSAAMKRSLAVRDQHCRFPGCRQSTAHSDIDHTTDWQHGGSTSISNLAHLCRRHHTLKHHTPWTVTQKADGVLEWTSPTGRIYPDHPTSGVQFCTDEEFDPAPF